MTQMPNEDMWCLNVTVTHKKKHYCLGDMPLKDIENRILTAITYRESRQAILEDSSDPEKKPE